ncbi:hypothetical protein AGR2A_Cc80068 [Agrobacterium genomosp. 2 str. CFBP 5494]|uniref:Uncharacterized protein n=1 Tax=Agrobacterium genomosp. 2 str. CFBP 5494 TaxID=1183436 RepID=A0A9W5B2X0_9HYPH|nr:hypothetical protein AGR2A_Cc80068 [Agrobacterium genomosp. 2 str. CFBP 5494]
MNDLSSVMPDLIRHPADARLRGERVLFSPRTWAGWIPAQGRYDSVLVRQPEKLILIAKGRRLSPTSPFATAPNAI